MWSTEGEHPQNDNFATVNLCHSAPELDDVEWDIAVGLKHS